MTVNMYTSFNNKMIYEECDW